MHKLVGPVPVDERWSPQRESVAASLRLREVIAKRVSRAGARLPADLLWLRMWWETGGRETVSSLVLGPPAPLLAGAGGRRKVTRR